MVQETEVSVSGFKLKTPLCMGSLISPLHVLTTRYCFGSDKREELIQNAAYTEIVEFNMMENSHENNFKI